MAARKTSTAVPSNVLSTTTLAYAKETKGTFVYKTEDEGAAISTIYVSKETIGENAPTFIEVTITATA